MVSFQSRAALCYKRGTFAKLKRTVNTTATSADARSEVLFCHVIPVPVPAGCLILTAGICELYHKYIMSRITHWSLSEPAKLKVRYIWHRLAMNQMHAGVCDFWMILPGTASTRGSWACWTRALEHSGDMAVRNKTSNCCNFIIIEQPLHVNYTK